MSFRFVPKSVTLNDFEWRNYCFQVAAIDPFGLSWAMIISEIISQWVTCVLLCNSQVTVFTNELFVCRFVFYVVV